MQTKCAVGAVLEHPQRDATGAPRFYFRGLSMAAE
jgi:hypothetical protein